jgi:glycosyltransferase involved in cell wall biosynthesis
MQTDSGRISVVICKGGFISVDGSGELLVNYALHLNANGHHVRVLIAMPFDHDNKHYKRLRQAGITVDCVVHQPLYALLRVLRKIDRARARAFRRSPMDWERIAYLTSRFYFRVHRPDLVHMIQADATAPGMIRAAHAVGVPVLYQEVITPRYGTGSETLYDRLADVLHLCTGVTALSPIQAIEVRERIPYNGPVSVLPLISEDPVTEAMNARRNSVTFGFAARLEHWKGPLVLLEAFALLLKRCPSAYLRMAGTGPQEQEAIDRAKELCLADRCDFLGPFATSEDRSSFMRSLDVFVQPSFADGTPNSIIEAMAHGLPIVASSNGGIPDLVSPELGILVPSGDSGALADALARLAGDPDLRGKMGIVARHRYEELFSPAAVLPVLLDAYRSVMKKSRRTTGCALSTPARPQHPWVSIGG